MATHGAKVIADYNDDSVYPAELVDAFVAVPVCADVGDPASIRQVFARVAELVGR